MSGYAGLRLWTRTGHGELGHAAATTVVGADLDAACRDSLDMALISVSDRLYPTPPCRHWLSRPTHRATGRRQGILEDARVGRRRWAGQLQTGRARRRVRCWLVHDSRLLLALLNARRGIQLAGARFVCFAPTRAAGGTWSPELGPAQQPLSLQASLAALAIRPSTFHAYCSVMAAFCLRAMLPTAMLRST
ncbi:hypothetical protein L226DRAFT_377102 [Lentinus tigrinus ALCF2SS1-7]|uniref:Uncharacterized protein n=1 Tax=Lentinus tigrinus ALCF2SS1-6 TaxID=1328759 RepID=A0A5C2SKI5_9APHY|nr:hypothetical protein L227DRAFT_322685 [Lentinus tigrinus ALCF2SS1-6]RPD76452.1 hypothetical protein L226DRAFT_377102 [Lentinus tigrinus ALCF2SS1-7]